MRACFRFAAPICGRFALLKLICIRQPMAHLESLVEIVAVCELSITHIFSQIKTEFDIGEASKTAPHHSVAWWWIVSTSEVTS